MKLGELCTGCHHPRGYHKRGWGPCQHSRRTTVLDAFGRTLSDTVERCECGGMETSAAGATGGSA